MSKYKIVEIFDSIEGEGKRSGQLATFVRTAGCNLRCSYCDTLYALSEKNCEYTELTSDEIISRLNPLYRKVTLTGGEPLFHPNIKELISEMCSQGYEVNVETNGSIKTSPFRVAGNVFFTIDYKLPCSGMESRMDKDAFLELTKEDVVKFVIGTKEDCDKTTEVVRMLQSHYDNDEMPQIYLSAVCGKICHADIVTFMKNHKELSNARIQLQMHKIIWPDIDKGV